MKRLFLAGLMVFIFVTSAVSYTGIDVVVTTGNPDSLYGLLTYSWMPDTSKISGDTLISKITLGEHIKSAIDKNLEEKGYRIKESGKVDFLVSYDFVVKKAFKHTDIGMGQEMTKGVLDIIFSDPKTKEIIWSAKGRAEIYRQAFRKNRIQKLNNAIRKILDKLPQE